VLAAASDPHPFGASAQRHDAKGQIVGQFRQQPDFVRVKGVWLDLVVP